MSVQQPCQASIVFQNVSFGYETYIQKNVKSIHLEVLHKISCHLKVGGITVILGPSGCGKSTILNLLAGELAPQEGIIRMPNPSATFGFVFQTPTLMPWKSVLENALFGLTVGNGSVSNEAKENCKFLLDKYGLAEFEHKFPRSLSGGMQQRLSLVRAMVANSDILLLDEPFSNSDFVMRYQLQNDLSDYITNGNKTIVMVTHDIDEALRLADAIIILSDRPSTVLEEIEISIPRAERLKLGFQLDRLSSETARIRKILLEGRDI